MDNYVQEILDVLWEIEGWKRDEARDRKNVRKLMRECSPETIDLVAIARDMDWWCSEKPDKPPTVQLLRSFAKKAMARGEARPYGLTVMGAALSVEEQLRLKEVKRRAVLERMGQ